MASTPTSLNAGAPLLRFVDLATYEHCAWSSLVYAGGTPDGVDICEHGYVTEGASYEYQLLATRPFDIVKAEVEVEGRSIQLELAGSPLPAAEGSTFAGRYVHILWVRPGNYGDPFALVYALVRVQLSLVLRSGEILEYSTLDIPCVARREDPDRGRLVEAMLLDLAQGDDEAYAWMFSKVQGPAGRWGVCETGAAGPGGATSARLSAVSASLDEFEACLGAVRVQCARRVRQAGKMVPAREVRRCGHAEAAWLARHPDVLAESPQGTVRGRDGRSFSPRELVVSTPVRSTDTPENAVVLGFLYKLCDDLARMEADLQVRAERAERALSRLERIDAPTPSRVRLPHVSKMLAERA